MVTETSNRKLFEEYLRKTPRFRTADIEQITFYVNYIEKDLLYFLQRNSITSQVSIYKYVDKEDLYRLMTELLPNHELSSVNIASAGKLRESLNFLIGFIDSRYHPLSEKRINIKKRITKALPLQATTAKVEATSRINAPAPYDILEGKKFETTVTKYERNQENRKDCIAHYGYVCQVCQMNFEETYGNIGKDFIEVHHLHPVSQGERQVNPIVDLIPLCSNCHSMIHRQEDVSDWHGLKERYLFNRTKDNKNEEEHN